MPGESHPAPPDPGVRVPYSPQVTQRVIDLLYEGVPFYKLASHEGMPNTETLYAWRDKYPEFSEALARARRSKAERLADEGLGIVDAVDPDCPTGNARVSKAREQAAYRQWYAAALDRDGFGTKGAQVNVQLNTSLVAFVDMAPKPQVVEVEADSLPHVEAPDGVEPRE